MAKSLPELINKNYKTKDMKLNEGIKSLPELLKGNVVKKGIEVFAGLYAISYWVVNFYCIYQLCCYTTSANSKRIEKIISAIIFYAFLTIIASVIL